jgi:hypothetical protein
MFLYTCTNYSNSAETYTTCINCYSDGRTVPIFLNKQTLRDPESELEEIGTGQLDITTTTTTAVTAAAVQQTHVTCVYYLLMRY